MADTLRFIRADATTLPGTSHERPDDPRMASRLVGLDGAPDP